MTQIMSFFIEMYGYALRTTKYSGNDVEYAADHLPTTKQWEVHEPTGKVIRTK